VTHKPIIFCTFSFGNMYAPKYLFIFNFALSAFGRVLDLLLFMFTYRTD